MTHIVSRVIMWCSACLLHVDSDPGLRPIRVSPDGRSFFYVGTNEPFQPRGLNYDHDDAGRLLEDYWETGWDRVVGDFREMKALGANVVRIHLQVGKFMETSDKPNAKALERLGKLIALAEHERLYLNLTGLGCYHKADVPAWYDRLSEQERWQVQARFWSAVAKTTAHSPAIFCYDLMNEPVVAAARRKDGEWLGPPFGGKHFVQFINLDPQMRDRSAIAREWIATLRKAIRAEDKEHLITVGLVDWSLNRKGLTSGFVPAKIVDEVDFVSVHIYPEKGKVKEALETLAGFHVGKPVVIEETFALKCSLDEWDAFIEGSRKDAVGWFGFYWGKPPVELRQSKELRDAILLAWLERFQKQARHMTDK